MQQINLYDKLPKIKRQFITRRNVALAYSLLALLLGLIYFVQLKQNANMANEIQLLTAKSTALSNELTRLSRAFPYSDQETLKKEVERLDKTYQEKLIELNILLHLRHFSAYLTGLGNTIVPGVWLSEFSFSRDEVKIELKGYTLQPALISRYLSALAKLPLFAGLSFTVNEIEQETYPANFHITAKLVEPI